MALINELASSAVQKLGRILPAAGREEGAIATRAARPVMAADEAKLSAAARAFTASVVPFDVTATEQQLAGGGRLASKLEALGWGRDPRQVGLDNQGTFLHYAVAGTDEWKDAPLQYLRDGRKGFLLRDVAPGTEIQAAPHVIVDQTHNGWYSVSNRTPDDASAWLTGHGESLDWKTQTP